MLEPSEAAAKSLQAARFLSDALNAQPPVAVVFGTGWGGLSDGYATLGVAPFDDIPGFGPAGAPGHRGVVKAVETEGGPLLVQDGRLHCYEGYSSLEACFPVWAYAALGVKVLVLLSAAGGLNPAYTPGDLMIVRDHIYLFGANPLIGVPEAPGCDRFIMAADFYPESVQEALRGAVPAEARCEQGVYAYTSGPSFETESEASLLRIAGADAVGMSTAPEAIVARSVGMAAGAVCCISNMLLPYRTGASEAGAVLDIVRGTASTLTGFLDRIATFEDMIG
jgi:purine-nucleoside phosphorylase